ncbi:hypothetical protein AK88_04515 [Plasmodium fragile]|uniref:Uncharacterized protein n=1 Tax=Plasmodium fragile TaxID=5857 RepID=A0A0D9QGC5_PLAFR|nr:uncharacterized protein AK88_04515 [Plasmodium fragile]KJP85867.1 hypothetical protein AK88_04515 [Plasmodium fragile]
MNNLSNWTNGIEGETQETNMKDTNRDLPVEDSTYECRIEGLQTEGCYSDVTNLGEAASLYLEAIQQGSARESSHSNDSLDKESRMCEQVSANNDISLERHDSCLNTLANSALSGMEGPPQNVERDQGDAGIRAGGHDQGNGQASDYQNGLMNDHPGNHINDHGANPSEAAPPVAAQQSVKVNQNNLHDEQNEKAGNHTSSQLQIEEKQTDGRAKCSLQGEYRKTTKEITQPTQRENHCSEKSHSSDVNDYTHFGKREREAAQVEGIRKVSVTGESFVGEDPRGDYCDADNANLPPYQEEQNEKYKNNDEVLGKGNEPRVSAPSDDAINNTSLGTDASRSSESIGSSARAADQIQMDSKTSVNCEITQHEYKKKRDITEVGDDSHLSNAKKKINFYGPVNNTLTCDHEGRGNCDAAEFEASKMRSPSRGALGFDGAEANVQGSYKPNINESESMPSSEFIAAQGKEGVPREEGTAEREAPSDTLQSGDIAHPSDSALPNGTVRTSAPPNVCTTCNAQENACDKIQDLARLQKPDTLPTSLKCKMDSMPPEMHAESGTSPPNEIAHAHAPLTKLPTPFYVHNAEGKLPRREKNGKDGEDETNIDRREKEKKLRNQTIVHNLESENKTEHKLPVEREITVEAEKKTEKFKIEKNPNLEKNQRNEKITSSEKNSKGQKGTPRTQTTQTSKNAQVALHTLMEQTAHAPNSTTTSTPVRSSMSFNEVPLENLNQGLHDKQMQNSKQFPSQHEERYPSDNQPFPMDQGTNTFSTKHHSSVELVGASNLQKEPLMENLENGTTLNDHIDICTLGSEAQGEELKVHLPYDKNEIINGDLARGTHVTSLKTAGVANAHHSGNHLSSANTGTSQRSGSGVNGVSDQDTGILMNGQQLQNFLNEQMKTGNPVHRELPIDTIPKQMIKKKVSEDTIIQDNENEHIEYSNNDMVMREVSQDTIVNDMMEDTNMSMERNKEMILKKITQDAVISSIHKPNVVQVNNDRLGKNVNLDTTISCMHSEDVGSVRKDILLQKLNEHEAMGELLGGMSGMKGVGVVSGMEDMDGVARMNGRNGMHHMEDVNEESTRDDVYHPHHVLYNHNPQSEMNGSSFKEQIDLQRIMGFQDQQSLISCAHNDSLGNHCEVNGAYNNGLNNHSMHSNNKEVDSCSNVDFTDDKYSQWFDTIYTVCVKLDDLCCKLNSDYPHSMHIWESNGNPSVYDLKSAFQNSNNLKMLSQSNQVDKVPGGVSATVPPSIYNDLNSSHSSGNSNYRYAVTHVGNNNEGAMKRHDHFVQDNFDNGLPVHVKNNCKDLRRMYGMNNINGNNQCVKDLAHVYSACDDHLRRIQTKNENGRDGRRIQQECALQRELYNHGNSSALHDNALLYDREKNGMKNNIAVLPGGISKDALELLHAYGKADPRVNDRFKVELYNALPQYKGHGDGTERVNHGNCGHRGAAPFSRGIPAVINNSSNDMPPRNGDCLSMANNLNANGLMQYVKNENNDRSKNANDASANTTKRKKGGKKNTANNSKSVEKRNIKKYGTVNRPSSKIIKNESEFEYLLELSDKEGPNLENPDDLKCDVAGVYWDKRSWIASWYDNGKRYYKSFSAKTHGFYKSKFWAIKVRLSKVKGQTIFGKNCRKNKDADGSNSVHNNLTFNSSIVSENNNVLLGNI